MPRYGRNFTCFETQYFGVGKYHVSPDFTVSFMLAFLLSQVLESVGASCGKEARETVGLKHVAGLGGFWERSLKSATSIPGAAKPA